MLSKRFALAMLASLALLLTASRTDAQGPPAPQPAPGSPHQHIFYGATRPGAGLSPVLVFVHGLSGVAHDWWVNNDMYALAYTHGYRTAFISLNRDNTRNSATIEANAVVLREAFAMISAHFDVPQFYVIAHSKGGIDVQAALQDPAITRIAKGVFTIATPHSGTELADWAFGPGRETAEKLDALLPGVLLSPGLLELRTANMESFRANADPFFWRARVPFYTLAGDRAIGNPVLVITGDILKKLTGNQANDGLVPIGSSRLPSNYSVDLGELPAHHFQTFRGIGAFWRIAAEIQSLEQTHSFLRVATDGWGDPHNSWPWFMKWFKGKLYVGSGRAVNCTTFATALVQTGQPVYPPPVGDCPRDFRDLSLAAEIWRFTPETGTWERVFKSPEDVPIGGFPEKYTARDVGFRGAAIVREPSGQDVLYVSGVSASSLFEDFPPYDTLGFPPPRILRSVDGVNWAPVPQAPGTFLGDIVRNSNDVFKVRGFRTMEVFKGQLFVTMTDYRGVGVVIGSARPWEGNNAWRQVSPPAVQLPVWTIRAFNGQLYAGTGDRRENVGYGVWRSSIEGLVPTWTPVVTNGGWQAFKPLRSANVLNMLVYKGALYVGTDRPTELIRVHPDDTWDLLVGGPRLTPQGMKKPLSSITTYFGNTFNGHFWNLGIYGGELYLGTWDWSVLLKSFGILGEPFRSSNGLDLFKTSDGVHWSIVTNGGFGDPWNYGLRSLESTPFGFFIGAAKPQDGLQVWRLNTMIDFDKDGDLDQNDVNHVLAAVGEPASGPDDARDLDRDGLIDLGDASRLATQCYRAGCEVIEGRTPGVPPPVVSSVSRDIIGDNVRLNWAPVPGAARYRVYKQPVKNILGFVPEGFAIKIPGTNLEFTLDDILAGKLDFLCQTDAEAFDDVCALIDILQAIDQGAPVGFPDITRAVAITAGTSYTEIPEADGERLFQSIYFVRAEDAAGNLSAPSNIVGGPSYGAATIQETTPPEITAVVSPAPNAAGWHNGDVTVTWQIAGAAATTGCDPMTVTEETAGTSVTCRAENQAGVAGTNTVTIRIDKTPPVITATRSPDPDASGWNSSDVTVTFECSDPLSGLAECPPTEALITTEGAGQSRTGRAVDVAGNAAETNVTGINIDKPEP